MATSSSQVMYGNVQPQPQPQYQYYAPQPAPLLAPLPAMMYAQPPPLPYEQTYEQAYEQTYEQTYDQTMGGLKRPSDEVWGGPVLAKRPRPDSGGMLGLFPQRPGEKVCAYYMTTRTCSFGPTCRFDHPAWVPFGGIPNWKEVTAATGAIVDAASLPQRPGEPDCAYYMKQESANMGSNAGSIIPRTGLRPAARTTLRSRQQGSGKPASLNTKGLPLRPVKLIVCTMGRRGAVSMEPHVATTILKLAGAGGRSAPLFPPGVAPSPATYGPPMGYQMGAPEYAYTGTTTVAYPQRPGEPDCGFYLKTGECSFGATCRFNHPPNRVSTGVGKPMPPPGVVKLTLAGLPRRVGETACAYYMKTGACKFGSTCKFDHPPPGEVAAKAVEAARNEASPALDNNMLLVSSGSTLDNQAMVAPGSAAADDCDTSSRQP